MQYLENKMCYMSGAIESANPMVDWRTEPKNILKNEFGINVFDPHSDPKQQWLQKLKIAKEKEDYDSVEEIAGKFVRKDLCVVDRCDFLIAFLQKNVPTTGTVHEIINSNNAKKPTILICPDGKKHISSWYFGFISHKNMFSSWNCLYEYLREVNDGKHKDDDRWHFVYNII